jgi:hypothetical protein
VNQATVTQARPDEGIPFVRRHDPAIREQLSGPGLRTFLNIAGEWGLSVDQQRLLLGGVAPSTYHKWKAGAVGTLSYDQLERLSLADGSPLERMLRGSIDDLYAVRRYLDGWRGGWP